MRKISYNNLWKKLIDMNMNKKDLCLQTKIASSTIAKMTANKKVSFDIIIRLCDYFDCNIEDIVTVYKDEESERKEKQILIDGLETLKKICDNQHKSKLSKVLDESIKEIKNKSLRR